MDNPHGPGPYHLAPIDDAFAEIPEADLEALLADNAALTDALTTTWCPVRP